MPTRADGVSGEVHEIVERTRTVARLEAELATMELKKKASALGAGVGVLAVAALLGFFALAFLLATVAAALANVWPTWLALLVVGAVLAVVAGICAAVALRLLQRGSPPVPEQAIEEAKLAGVALRGNGRG